MQHDQVDFTQPAAKIAFQCLETMTPEKRFSQFLPFTAGALTAYSSGNGHWASAGRPREKTAQAGSRTSWPLRDICNEPTAPG